MIGTVLVVVLVLAIGSRATDAVRLRQQQTILDGLPRDEAVAYYRVLQRRAWKVRFLRAVALLSVLALLYARGRAQRRRLAPAAPSPAGTVAPGAPPAPSSPPSSLSSPSSPPPSPSASPPPPP